MDIDIFNQSLQLVARLVSQCEYYDASIVLQPWLDTSLSNFHKGIVCVNLAVVSEHLGQEEEALAWYDRGIEYERPEARVFVTEQKAAYLAGKGRQMESLQLYEKLLRESGLTTEERERIEYNIGVLRDQEG